MAEVANYEMVVTVEGKEIVIIQKGYLNFTKSVENYPWVRVEDVNGMMWAIHTTKISSIRIRRLDEEGFVPAAVVEDDE
jgi:hypothetical protein